MRSLAELQRQFESDLGVASVETAALAAYAGTSQRAQQGLEIYRGNIRANTARALGAAYPVVEQIVGAEFFFGLAARYCRRFPSESGDLNEFGEFFAIFLADFKAVAEFPYLADVARLEWRVHRAHYAADPEPFNPACLAALSPDEQAAMRPRLHPACSVLQSAYPVARIWEVHQASFSGEFEVKFAERPTYALVLRPRFRVEVAAISDAEAAFLLSCHDGQTLEAALAAARERDEAFDLARALGAWVASAVIVDFTCDEALSSDS